MPYSSQERRRLESANSRKLHRLVLFSVLGEVACWRCGSDIGRYEDFSLEHKKGWSTLEEYLAVNNIGFSHLACNKKAGAAASGVKNKRKTSCKRGHKFNRDNTRTYLNKYGNVARQCIACRKIRKD